MKKSTILTIGLCAVVAILFIAILMNANTPDGRCPLPTHTDPVKVADHTYEMTYTSYSFEDAEYIMEHGMEMKYFEFENGIPAYGCSAVTNGRFMGRNYDLHYSDGCQIIIKVPADESIGRHASIGISGFDWGWTPEFMEKGMEDEYVRYVPWVTMDGMNDAGVACCVCMSPEADLEESTTGTNPGAQKMNMMFLTRMVLDYADSAKDAVEMIKGYDINEDAGILMKGGWEIHLMITDRNSSYVVEFINNKVAVLENVKVIANFYESLDRSVQEHGMGFERADVLLEGYDSSGSMEGMGELMAKARYSLCIDPDVRPIRYSDLIGYPVGDGGSYPSTVSEVKAIPDEAILDRISKMKFPEDREPDYLWWTLHTSVFDTETLKMSFFFQENYREPLEYDLSKPF